MNTLRALCATLLILSGSAYAQFQCEPKTPGNTSATGTEQRSGKTATGSWIGHWCPGPPLAGRLTWTRQYFAVLDKYRTASLPLLATILAAPDRLTAVNEAILAGEILPPAGSQDAHDFAVLKREACLGLTALPLMAPEMDIPADYCGAAPTPPYVWRVKVNSTYSFRASYLLVNGVRGTVSQGNATVGQPCDVTLPTLPTNADVWASFGPTPIAGKVTLCSKAAQ